MVNLNVIRRMTLEMETKGAAQAQAELDKVAAAEDRVADGAAKMSARMSVETDKTSRAVISVARSYDAALRSVDAAYAGQVRYESVQRRASQALKQGVIDAAEYARAIELAAAKHLTFSRANDNVVRGLGLQRHEWVNLSRQMQDVLTMGAMGASPGQILSSQGAQIFDIFSSAEAGPAAALRAVAPYAAAVGGLAVTFGAAGKAAWDFSQGQDAVARSLQGVGRLSGATVAGINGIAEASADMARVSVAMAREMGSQFARTGRINQDLFGEMTVTASRFARMTGTEIPEAAQKLAEAFGGDIVRGATELNKQLGFMSGRTLEMIERQVAMGDRTGATRVALDAMKTSLLGATEQTNGWAAAYDKLALAAKRAYAITGRAVMEAVAPTDEQQLADRLVELEHARAAARQGGNVNQGDPEHLRWMQQQGYTSEQIRRELTPTSPGAMTEKAIADAERRVSALQDEVKDLNERIMWAKINAQLGQREAEINAITLRAKDIVAQMSPSTGDMLQLTQFRTELQKALDTGQAPSGTAETLARVNQLLKDGGTQAHQMAEAARDAFSVAGLLPYQRGLADIENQYQRLIATATDPRVIAGLSAAKEEAKRAFAVTNTDVVRRDYRMHLGEMERAYEFQRDSFGQAPEVLETMRAKMEMLNEATRNGQSVTERYGSGWESLAAQMGKAKGAAEELQRTQQSVIQGMDEMRAGSRGLFTGIFSDLRQGKDPRQSILSSLGRMQDQMFDRVVSRPFVEGMMGRDGTGQGGLLSQGFGGLMGFVGAPGSGKAGGGGAILFDNDNGGQGIAA